MITDVLTVGSLFSGIGGIELGLERTGRFKTLWQVEIDEYCNKVLEKHWPNVRRYGDVKKVKPEELGYVDVITAGFPCQDISAAGRRVGIRGERSGLFFEVVRIVRTLRPKYILLENVAALTIRGIDVVLGEMALCGYDAEWDCISAASVGALHRRDRIFIIGIRRDVADTLRQGAREPEQDLRRRWKATVQYGCGLRDGTDASGEDVADTDQPGYGTSKLGCDIGTATDNEREAGRINQSSSGYALDEPGRQGSNVPDTAGDGRADRPEQDFARGKGKATKKGRPKRDKAEIDRVAVEGPGVRDNGEGTDVPNSPCEHGERTEPEGDGAGRPEVPSGNQGGALPIPSWFGGGSGDVRRRRVPTDAGPFERARLDNRLRAFSDASRQWWAVAQLFRRVPNGLSEGLDENIIKDAHQSDSYAPAPQARPREILPGMRKEVGEEEIQRNSGEHEHLYEKEILRQDVHGEAYDEGESNGIGAMRESAQVHEGEVRPMPSHRLARNPSYRWEQEEQLTRELDDVVQSLSHEMALGAWEDLAEKMVGLSRLRRACEQIGSLPVREALSTLQEVWLSLSDEEKVWVILCTHYGPWHSEWPGVPRTIAGQKDRVARLKCLGNAVVPQCAEYVGWCIIEHYDRSMT